MQPPQQHSWINLAELKSQIIRKLGPNKSKQYFDYLNKFLSLKLTKVEFDKICIKTIGRDGIPLHNQLIRSILRNACTRKTPIGNKKPSDGVYHQNGSITHGSNPPALPNGDILSPSPRKARTGARVRRSGDHKSALGSNEKSQKSNYSSPSSSIENGHQQGKSLDTKHGTKNPLHAPLGIPFCPVGVGGARKAPPTNKSVGISDTDSLLETITLRARMEPVAATHGLQSVSIDCANALNNGLDAYIKGLIRSCCELNGELSGSGNGPIKSSPAQGRSLNGVRPVHQYQMQLHEQKRPISLLDFRVVMELNPRPLGDDWPVLLEKICTHAFED